MKNNIANNNRENLNKIKLDSIHLEILYRSLYILKKKFEKYKKDIKAIYTKYYPEKNKILDQSDFPIIKIVNFFPLLQEIFEKIKITIPRLSDIKMLFNYDISKFDKNSKEHLESIKLMEKNLFANKKKNLGKYNKLFYSKKIEPIVDYFNMRGNGNDLTEIKCITEYDRKGRIINTFGKLLENIGIKSSFKSITKNPKDEFDAHLEKGDALYIEILPIILADFLQDNNDFVVIDLDVDDDNFLSDIKSRFDENLKKKINNEKNANIFFSYKSNKNNNMINNVKKNLSPEEQKKLCEERKYKLEKNIKFYQNLLANKKKKGESYNYILDFISKMELEKERLDKEIKELTLKINAIIFEEQKIERKKEKKKDGTQDEKLHEIFCFYCSQHNAPSPYPTFAQIEYKGKHMNISEFCKFCTEFKIPLKHDKLIEIYNKRTPLIDTSEINFNEFIIILEKISIIMNENKINKYEKKIEKLNKKIKGLGVSSDSDEDISNNSDIKILSSKLEQYKKKIENLKSLDNAQIFNEFKLFLELDKPKKFRDKMKGFLYKYWDYTEKIERYAPLTRDEYQKVKRQVKLFKSMREKSAKEKEYKNEKLKQELYDKKKEQFIINNKKLLKKIKDKEEKKSYMLLKNLHVKNKHENRNKFNFIKSNTYESIANLKMDLNKEEKEKLYINDEEENSDDELFNKNISNNKKEEISNIKIDKVKNIENNDNNANNSGNITHQNDNLSSINTSHTNASIEINKLKMNLRPKKKENIYYSSNNLRGINDITEEMKQKELDKKQSEGNNNIINNDLNKNITGDNGHKKEINRYKDLFPTTPKLEDEDNELKKETIPVNNYLNSDKKRPIGIHKNIKIPKEISPLMNNNNKKTNKITHFKDSYNNKEKNTKNNSLETSNKKSRSNIFNHKNKIKNNIINYTENNQNQKKIQNVIKLPSLNLNKFNMFDINNETNRMTAHFKESKSTNVVNTVPNNNVIVLPSINNQRYNIDSKEKLNNIDNNI